MKYVVVLMVTAGIPFTSFSQKTGNDTGTITIIQDDRVDQLISKHVQINQQNQDIDGYRIQIFFDSGNNSKTAARSIHSAFITKYPNVKAYLTFKAPNYKVRVGDFRSKLDAQRFLNEIITDYPGAWIITDKINLPQVEP